MRNSSLHHAAGGAAALPAAPPLRHKGKKIEHRHSLRSIGGGRWIRTTEVSDNRFTVCPIWPLWNSPI